ncbi:hypothetical protein [Propionivibrio sp.]|uniref:hypothetical protein n=1 Tax=Propionivibrio sp. TaxID=2212460 RepID=UPI003BF20556
MSNCYSPIGRCEAEHTMVRINQTLKDCSLEHGCPPGRICPLGACFAKIAANFRSPQASEIGL